MSNYEYLNARLRAMYSRLLSKEYFLELLSLEDVDLLIDSLLNSPYAVELSEALASYSGPRAVDVAIRENLSKETQKILELAEGNAKKWIRLLLSKWDYYNIKTIFRGKLRKVDSEDIYFSLIPLGDLRDVHLRELVVQEDIRDVLSLLSTWDYQLNYQIREALLSFEENQENISLIEIENLIDTQYFDEVREVLKRKDRDSLYVEEIVKSEIDLQNILICFKLISEGGRPDKNIYFFIEGGNINKNLLEEMLKCNNLEDSFVFLEKTEFFSAIEKGILHFAETGRLAIMERFLEEIVIRKGASMFRGDPLSICIGIGYLWKKYNEFINLRFIARGIEYRMPKSAIKGELIFA